MSIIDLIGVLDDGSPLAPRVPQDTGRTLQIPRASDSVIRFSLVTNSGLPVALVSPATLVFTLDKSVPPKCNAEPALLIKSATFVQAPSQPNMALFTFVPTDTRTLFSGRYWYDVWYTAADGSKSQVVRLSTLHLLPTLA